MAFSTFEESQEGSRPIELYTFTTGSDVQRWTSAEDDIVEGSDTFIAVNIRRSALKGGGPDSREENVKITVPRENSVAAQYINSVPGVFTDVVIERIQRTDGPSYEVVLIFEGRISSVAFAGKGITAEISVQPIISATSRPIPRFTYMGLCNHVLYDDFCQISDSDPLFRLSGAAVTAETGLTITVTGANDFGTGYYNGGWAEALAGADRRLILDQTGEVLTLLLPFNLPVNGTNVTLFAGCDHSISICKSKFNNVINFGGFAFVPKINIFTDGISDGLST